MEATTSRSHEPTNQKRFCNGIYLKAVRSVLSSILKGCFSSHFVDSSRVAIGSECTPLAQKEASWCRLLGGV